MRAKLVPASAIDDVAEAGAGFAGFATWLDMTPADPDMLVMPESTASFSCRGSRKSPGSPATCIMGGEPVEQAPRKCSSASLAAPAASGYELKTGVECEFFLIAPDGRRISDGADQQSKALLRPAGADAPLRRRSPKSATPC